MMFFYCCFICIHGLQISESLLISFSVIFQNMYKYANERIVLFMILYTFVFWQEKINLTKTNDCSTLNIKLYYGCI